jgi:UDP-N-acetylglucosamine 2-epimerase
LISTLTLQEAKDSSEIEKIITTHDDLYFFPCADKRPADHHHILVIHKELEQNNAVVYTPPLDYQELLRLMSNLVVGQIR